MKLTESQLRSIIRKEISRISEAQRGVSNELLMAIKSFSEEYVNRDMKINADITTYPTDDMLFISLPNTSVRVDVKHYEGRPSSIGLHGDASGQYLVEFSGEFVEPTQRVKVMNAQSIRGDDQYQFMSALEDAVNIAQKGAY